MLFIHVYIKNNINFVMIVYEVWKLLELLTERFILCGAERLCEGEDRDQSWTET